MTKTQQKYEIFIQGMITHGDQVKAYMEAYPYAKPTSARVSSYVLLRNATISSRIKEAAGRIREQAEYGVSNILKGNIVQKVMDVNIKRSILHKIAHADIELEKVFLGRNGKKVRIFVKPDYADVLKAIDLDNKMTGDYAPEQKVLLSNNNLKEKTDEELIEMIRQYNRILYDEDPIFLKTLDEKTKALLNKS